MIWQGDTDDISPNNVQRAAMYGVGGIPHAQFDGYTAQIGAGSTIYQTYLQIYNNHINYDSPLDMQLDFGINDSGNMAITADITVTGDIETAANKVVFILSRDITDDYFCSVAFYEFQDFDLTEIGETGTFSQEVVIEDGWDIGNLNAIAMIQTWANYPGTNQHKIIQARQTQYSGILPLFNANITEGPATLNVEFSENSFPIGEIDLFEWDLDGDGVFEEIGTDVSYSYNNEGSYEVSLRITVDGETATTTIPNYITVTDGSEISGSLSGVWSQTNNPYSITDDVLIEEGNELVIEAGTQISLENSAMISVFGKLSANGTIEEPIIFGSNSGWEGIKLINSTLDNQFSFCNFSNAVKSPINLQSSSATIEDCYFHDNTVSTSAAAINLLSAENVSIKRNLISNNISTNSAGAISVELCNPSIKNNVIVNNQGGIAGAINLRNITSVTIENNTIANNMATSAVSGLFFVYNSYPILQNNILIDDELLFYNLNSVITASYSCLSEEIDGNNNFVANPLFVDASAGSGAEFCGYSADWTLQEASPCIDAGSPNSMFNDIEDPENPGNPLWPAMGTLTNDIGAFGGSDCAVWVDNEEDSVIPDKRQISIFPNPFNPSTTISYNLDVDNTNNTKINIYNVIGQLVKHISVNKLSAGQHSVIWNGKDNSGNSVASGVYYFQVETDNIVDTTKGILLK